MDTFSGITDEAVEAAAQAIRNDDWPDYEDQLHHPVKDYMSNARAALEAAAPYLMAQAKAAALNEAAELIEPFSGIGMANGATRGDVARWLRHRAEVPRG